MVLMSEIPCLVSVMACSCIVLAHAHPHIHPCSHTHSQALKMYMRARDHCTSSKHIVQLCLNVIKVSLIQLYII